MNSSYDALLDELAAHGRGPRASEFANGSRFVKAHAPPTKNAFDDLLDRLESTWRSVQAGNQIRRMTHGDGTIAKALREVSKLRRSYYRPVIVRKDAMANKPGAGEVVAKALHALNHDASLTPAQRGALQIALGRLSDRVFTKSAHPAVDRLDALQAKLDAALASGQSGAAEGLIRDALKLIRRGSLTGPEHAHLSLLINELRSKLEAAADGSKQ